MDRNGNESKPPKKPSTLSGVSATTTAAKTISKMKRKIAKTATRCPMKSGSLPSFTADTPSPDKEKDDCSGNTETEKPAYHTAGIFRKSLIVCHF